MNVGVSIWSFRTRLNRNNKQTKYKYKYIQVHLTYMDVCMCVCYWLVDQVGEGGELSLRLSGTPMRVPLWAAAAFWHFWLPEALEAFNQVVVVAAALWALLLHLFESFWVLSCFTVGWLLFVQLLICVWALCPNRVCRTTRIDYAANLLDFLLATARANLFSACCLLQFLARQHSHFGSTREREKWGGNTQVHKFTCS